MSRLGVRGAYTGIAPREDSTSEALGNGNLPFKYAQY